MHFIHDGTLEIKGEQKNEYEEKNEGYVRREYSRKERKEKDRSKIIFFFLRFF